MPVNVATSPQEVVKKANQRLGLNFLITRLEGNSDKMYVTKRMETYSFVTIRTIFCNTAGTIHLIATFQLTAV